MSKRGIYNIIYAIVMVLIVLVIIIFNDLDDVITFILASVAFILTSIFTYSNRRQRK